MPQQQDILVIGHRGAMGYETENTIASIQKALSMQVDAIEIDVYKIKSGELVVFHDDTLERLSDATGNIEDYTWDELQKIVLTGGHHIPKLSEVLDTIDKQVRLNIELKGSNTATDTYAMVSHYIATKGWKLTDFLISSFKWEELDTMRKLSADMPIAVLTFKNPLGAIDKATELHAEAINPNYKKLNKQLVTEIHAKGFKVFPYTVNESSDITLMKTYGVDGIFTNYPDRVNP